MKLKKGYKIREIAGENVIIMQGVKGMDMTRLLSLNETSKWLYESLVGKEFDEMKVQHLLTERFEVDDATALKDARHWIEILKDSGIVEV